MLLQIRRKKKETALTKHKRWLAELQKKKDNLELQYTVDYIRDTQAKDQFMAGERKIRKQAKDILKPSKIEEKVTAAEIPAESKGIQGSTEAQDKIADDKGYHLVNPLPIFFCM